MNNLPKSLIDSVAKLHAKSDGDCRMCAEAERAIQYSSREIFEGLPWMKSNNIPPCLWSYGYYLTHYQDDGGYEVKSMESMIKFEVEKSGATEFTMDLVMGQLEIAGPDLSHSDQDKQILTEYYLENYGIDFSDMTVTLSTQCLALFLLSLYSMDHISSVAKRSRKEAEFARKQKIQLANHDDRSIEELMESFSKTNFKNSGKRRKSKRRRRYRKRRRDRKSLRLDQRRK